MQDNSIIISPEQQDAYRLDAELKHNAQTVIGGIVEIGRCLKEINDRKLYELLGFSGLAEYAEAAVGLKERAAYNYITAYETYGEQGLQQYGQLGITKLVALAQLNDEDRTEMLESGKAEELSTRKLNDEIKKLKGENDQLRFQLDGITEGVEKQDAEIADKDAEIADLKKQLEEAHKPASGKISKDERKKIREEMEAEVWDEYKVTREKQKDLAVKEAVEAEKKKAEKELHKLYEKLAILEPDNEDFKKKVAMDAEEIKKLKAEIEKLQANAKTSAPTPAPAGNKELLKYHFEGIKTAYIGAVEVLERFDANEREKYKTALIKIAEDIKAAAGNM